MGGEFLFYRSACMAQPNQGSNLDHALQHRRSESDIEPEMLALATVLGTTELLEMILLQLDLRTLLKVQQVCQRWKQITTHSTQLQQALYIKPAKPSNKMNTSNPLIEEIILPQLLLRSRNFVIPGKYPNFEPCFRREASWRKMLPQQTPTSTIGVIEIVRHERYKFTKLTVNTESIRMEHLLEATENGVLMPTPNNRVFWATVCRSLNFEIWGQNWVKTKSPLPKDVPWIPANVDWDTLRLGVAAMRLEQSGCDFIVVSEWPQRLFQDDMCPCQKTNLDRWLEDTFGQCEVVVAREEASHTCAFKEGNVPVLRQLCEQCCCRRRFARRLFIP